MTRDRGPGRWPVLTGEYPPQFGGVADYSGQLARGLAGRGEEVHVWAPPLGPGQGGGGDEDDDSTGVTVHRRAGRWARADLERIGRAIDLTEPPRRIVLQYVPNAFGFRGMNLGLGRWLLARRRKGDRVRVMFHEVTYVVKPGDRPARRALAFVQRRLVNRLLRAADAVDVGTPCWEPMLRPLDRDRDRPYNWRPVPSNIPVVDDPEGVAAIRGRLMPGGASALVGSFGTFARDLSALLDGAALPALLGHPDRAMVLIGLGSDRAADAWLRRHPELAGRLSATGALAAGDVSRHLRACDLLIQPYPGGASTKRGSLMAGIGHGRATVANSGDVTEPVWAASGALALAPEGDGAAMAALAGSLLADGPARARLGAAARALYEDRFDLRHTIDALIADG